MGTGGNRDTNYRVAYNKFWQDVKKRNPEEITAARRITYNKETEEFTVRYFGEEYLLDSHQETIYRKKDGKVPDIMDAIIILNYLAYAQLLPETEPRWVSIKEIPGCMIFYSAFQKTALMPLIQAFGKRPEALVEVAPKFGGAKAQFGDASAVFQAFPEIPLCVVVWAGDEEVPANATILYDSSIGPMLHGESIIGLGMTLANRLCRQVKG